MDVVLVNPEIPHNAGCAGRLTAAAGVRLHLAEPLGFSLEDRYLKRAGLDYWASVDLTVHSNLEALMGELEGSGERPLAERLKLFTARGGSSLFEAEFRPDDVLLFGSESKGLPGELLERADLERVYVPIRREIRSLNLANTVALGLYVALDRAGVPMPDNDGEYRPHPDADLGLKPGDVLRREP